VTFQIKYLGYINRLIIRLIGISVRYEGYEYNKDECLCRFFVSNHSELW